MEGLFIHAVLRGLMGRLPSRALGWVFPDEGTAALLLEGVGNLVLRYRPPRPLLGVELGRLWGEAKTPFQRLLEARCKGRLLAAEQLKLDRVVFFDFEGERGFVDIAPTRLVFELTGRNANLILCDLEGRILGLDRPVPREVNRYRELRPGLPYVPPPPYQKLDPRTLKVEDLAPFLGQPLLQLIRNLDGVGKELTAELLRRVQLPSQTPLAAEHLPLVHEALQRLVAQPAGQTRPSEGLQKLWEEEAEALRKPLREALQRQRKTLQARLLDYRRALERLEEAERLRGWGTF